MTRRFLFVLGSARRDGNSASLARRAAEQLPAGTEQHWIDLTEHPLPEFEDLRHDSDPVRPAEEMSPCCSTPPSRRRTW